MVSGNYLDVQNGCNISKSHNSQSFRFILRHKVYSSSLKQMRFSLSISFFQTEITEITEYNELEHAIHERVNYIYSKIICNVFTFSVSHDTEQHIGFHLPRNNVFHKCVLI